MENIRDLIKYSGFLGGSAGSGGTGGAQPDLSAGPGEPGHVLNRTHYSEVEEIELLPETAGMPQNFSGYDGFAIPGALSSLLPGKTYKVKYNSVEYTVTSFEMPASWNNMVAMGNTVAIGGANTGEPFAMVQLPAEYQAMGVCVFVIPLDGSQSVSVSITWVREIVHKLDMKYLPTPMIINCKNNSVDKSFEEICSHLESGGMAYLRRFDSILETVENYPFVEMNASKILFSYCEHSTTHFTVNKVELDSSGYATIHSASGKMSGIST